MNIRSSWHCNQSSKTEPDGLPAGWCRQQPIDGISLWVSKISLLFSVATREPKLVTVLRRITNGNAEKFTFRLNGNVTTQPATNSEIVIWLTGTDTGSIELIDVIDSPLDGDLGGLGWLKLEALPNPHIRNFSSHTIYVGLVAEIKSPYNQSNDVVTLRHCLEPNRSTPLGNDGDQILSSSWHAAEIQRSNLYTP